VTRRLLLLRHGRTAWNAVRRAQGHADVELDATGHGQAVRVARQLAMLTPAAIWSSDLLRARRTAEYLAAETGLPVKYDARLREIDVGQRQGLTLDEFSQRFPQEYAAWTGGLDVPAVPGAEVAADVVARVVPTLRECLGSLAPGETGVVVGHGASMKIGMVALLGWPADLSATLRSVDNCAWVTVEETEPGGRLRLAGYNEKPPPEPAAQGRMGP
jgi:broad specificity phosphatase PhoE